MEVHQGSSERSQLFKELKPCCVQLLRLAVSKTTTPDTFREIQELSSQLYGMLGRAAHNDPDVLNDNIAEYVFFSLNHVFRHMAQRPARITEYCVKCLELLINYGWRSRLSAEHVQQIYSILVFVIDGTPASRQRDRDVPEELQLSSFQTLDALLTTASQSLDPTSELAKERSRPVMCHGVVVMLEGAVGRKSLEIQIEALKCLDALFTLPIDYAALLSVFPGTLSSLTNLLARPGRYKSSVLAKSLTVVRTVLIAVLSDIKTNISQIGAAEQTEPFAIAPPQQEALTPTWLQATLPHVKTALSHILGLRSHASQNVRDALGALCVALLDQCRRSLSDCTPMLVETAIILDNGEVTKMVSSDHRHTDLQTLVIIYPELIDMVTTSIHDWMTSLPRIVQDGEDNDKVAVVRNLSKGLHLLQTLSIESALLEDTLRGYLRDAVVCLVQDMKHTQSRSYLELLDGSQDTSQSLTQQTFEPLLMAHVNQRTLREAWRLLIDCICLSALGERLAFNMMYRIRDLDSTDQIASFWLCFEFVKVIHASMADAELVLDMYALSASGNHVDSVSEELLSFSTLILELHADFRPADWRLAAIALEVAAYFAQRLGALFRPHLIDVLFPVATFLGSDEKLLRQHAIAALNCIATSCGYESVSELILQNVDYMVNSVSLKFNSLDISPSSVQVLRMMIRLTGPRLIPYLDDIVGSIFGALESYHGYALLVESLFSVLTELVNQASAVDPHVLIDRERIVHDHRKKRGTGTGMGFDDIMMEIDGRETEEQEEAEHDEQIRGHPEEPWTRELPPEENGTLSPEQEKQPNSPTYQLVLRIAYHTQYYLTSPIPTLRKSLLGLLAQASSFLAGDEDSFLPLVNAIWPVVIERLRDSEPFVIIEACRALVSLCEAAGDFMRTRFTTVWDEWLREWCKKVKRQETNVRLQSSGPRAKMTPPKPNETIILPIRSANGSEVRSVTISSDPSSNRGGSLGQYASPVKVWEAVVELLIGIVRHVHIDGAMFDDFVTLLAEVMGTNSKVREALETVNPEAVWVARRERGLGNGSSTRTTEVVRLVDV